MSRPTKRRHPGQAAFEMPAPGATTSAMEIDDDVPTPPGCATAGWALGARRAAALNPLLIRSCEQPGSRR